MTNKVIKYGYHTYSVKRKKIKRITFEIMDEFTAVHIFYKGILYPDFAFNIFNKDGKVDTALLSDVYVSIMALNSELLKKGN